MMICRIALVSCVFLFATTSCSSRTRTVKPPAIDPSAAAAAAVKQCDENGDGKLGKAELKNTALNLKLWDADGDGAIAEPEIAERLQSFLDSGVGLATVPVFVLWNDKPLSNATVVFEPETFLGDGVAPASGTTDDGGSVKMSVASELLPNATVKAMQPGLYKVRITHPEVTLPEKYNTFSTLTYEYSPVDTLPDPVFELTK